MKLSTSGVDIFEYDLIYDKQRQQIYYLFIENNIVKVHVTKFVFDYPVANAIFEFPDVDITKNDNIFDMSEDTIVTKYKEGDFKNMIEARLIINDYNLNLIKKVNNVQ